MSKGGKGTGKAQLDSPTGIAVGGNGNVLVADTTTDESRSSRPRVHFSPPCEAKGLDAGNWQHRTASLLIAPIYVLWTTPHSYWPRGLSSCCRSGTLSDRQIQFDDPTSVTVDAATNRVYVADPHNKRIQVFDSNGKFLTKWSVPEWGQAVGFEDLVIDGQRGPALCVERTHERRARF